MVTNVFTDKYNMIVGAAVAALTAVFGVYWYVFAIYLAFNIFDWLSGWYNARKKGQESSEVGTNGAVKKLGCWMAILVAFMISGCFVHIGDDLLGVNLSFLNLLGWWVLTMLIINEARSILENLVEIGVKVPNILIKGLAVTEKLVEAGMDVLDTDKEPDNITNKESIQR